MTQRGSPWGVAPIGAADMEGAAGKPIMIGLAPM